MCLMHYRDLSLYPYVQECLGLTGSSLFKGSNDAGTLIYIAGSLKSLCI